jgi:hypothetical protein
LPKLKVSMGVKLAPGCEDPLFALWFFK